MYIDKGDEMKKFNANLMREVLTVQRAKGFFVDCNYNVVGKLKEDGSKLSFEEAKELYAKAGIELAFSDSYRDLTKGWEV